jgi:mono/diheme cytochrome c family protein
MKHSRVITATVLIIFFLQIGITSLFAGELVRKAQESLIEKGIDPGPVDGLWGPMTRGAVKQFQKTEGLPVSGRLDDETKKHLFSFTHETLSTEKAAPARITQEPTEPVVPVVPEEKNAPVVGQAPVDKVLPKQTLKAPAPVETQPVMQDHQEPKAKPVSGVKKASGICPQPRKTKSAPASISRVDKTGKANSDNGKKIYHETAKPMACKKCHGDKGDGKGKLGRTLTPMPRNFTCQDTMQGISAGQMFWIIKNGSPRTGMVAHKKSLKDNEIWDVVKYIRSTFTGETPSIEKAVSKPASATIPAPPQPEAAEKASSAVSPARQLPKGFKVSGKYKEETVSNGGSISGVVKFSGKVPAPIMEDLSKGKNVEFCSTHPDAKGNIRARIKVATANGKLQDAVVFIQNIATGKAWTTEVNNFDFKSCDIFPKVSVIRKTPRGMKKGLLTITNLDLDILHNPHGYSVAGASRKTLFNKPLPSKGDVADVTRKFKQFKPSKDKHFFLQCDQHNYMEADARVVWNPYYSVSGGDGAFKIDHIPAGKYWVTAWHPYIGEVSQEVTVTAGIDATTDFELVK